MCVQEVSDGTADTMLKELDRQLAHLRKMANEVKIPNANNINWTLIVSSTSDGASTQSKFNKLLQEYKNRDEEQFGPANKDITQIIENKCGMHLGVNLRKAQNAGIQEYDKAFTASTSNEAEDHFALAQQDSGDQVTQNQKREYVGIDTFVHAFCKLLGQVGTPEYGQGISFRDFVSSEIKKSQDPNRTQYLEDVLKTNLERQVGSRYCDGVQFYTNLLLDSSCYGVPEQPT